jgi:hypothetical protein
MGNFAMQRKKNLALLLLKIHLSHIQTFSPMITEQKPQSSPVGVQTPRT